MPLALGDFAAVNPNTGTAPVFRSRRDAEITLGIYRRLPVLVDRRGEQPVSVWPACSYPHVSRKNSSINAASAEVSRRSLRADHRFKRSSSAFSRSES
jgi:hypothetical protein